jgi:hypothetical protein
MKFTSALFASLVLGASTVSAAPLAETTPVYAKPDAASATIASLKAGSEPSIAPGVTAPAGWSAVTLSGPHEVYAANKDVTKALEVRVGAPYFIDAKSDAPVLALAEKGDQTDIIDYRGKWTKFRLSRPVTGYIKSTVKNAAVASSANVAPAVVNTPASANTVPSQPVTTIGKAAPVGDGGSSALPRLFQGKFASTYNPLRPRRPYDFQLTDDSGSRYAYVDVSKLLATEQLNKYIDRTVVVYGTAQAVPGSKDMVVVAESLQLR